MRAVDTVIYMCAGYFTQEVVCLFATPGRWILMNVLVMFTLRVAGFVLDFVLDFAGRCMLQFLVPSH